MGEYKCPNGCENQRFVQNITQSKKVIKNERGDTVSCQEVGEPNISDPRCADCGADAQEQSDELFVVLDTSVVEGRDLAASIGEFIKGELVIRQFYKPDGACEACDAEGAYYLKEDPIGGLCREHLPDSPGYLKVVESKAELEKSRDSVPRPPTREEQQELKEYHLQQGHDKEQATALAESYQYAVFENYISDMPGYSGKVMVAVYGFPASHEAYIWNDEDELELVQPERAKVKDQ